MLQLVTALAILSTVSATQLAAGHTESSDVFLADFAAGMDTNFDAWPDRWTRRRDRGYPAYIPIRIVQADSSSTPANPCLQIRMDGGAAQVFTPAISIGPHYSYLLTARVRTKQLVHDVVSFSVNLYDGNDRLLDSFESEPIHQTDDWTTVELGPLAASSDQAVSAIISAHVRSRSLPDLSGTVWIDDLRLVRLPKMSIETNSDYNLYTSPRDVQVTCRVSGFTHANPVLHFELLDPQGRCLESSRQTVKATNEFGRARPRGAAAAVPAEGYCGVATWEPAIPDYGYYVIQVSSPEHSGYRENIVIAPPLVRPKKGEFGWSLPDGEHPLTLHALPALLAQAGLHWVKFPIWFSSEQTDRAEQVASFAERLDLQRVQLVGIFDQPPPDLQEKFGAKARMAAASIFQDRAVWQPAVEPTMTRLSLKVHWWQLGRDDDTSFNSYPNLQATIQGIRDELEKFGQQVHLGIPWRMIEQPPEVANPPWAFLSYAEPLPFTNVEWMEYLETKSPSLSKRWVVLQPLAKQHYNLETRGRDLVLQMIAAKTSDASGIFLANPFDEQCGVLNADGSPSEIFLPWRTTAMLVGGCEYLGSIELPEGSHNQVFAREQDGIMVLWNDRSVVESVCVGEDITLYDIWGRPTKAEKRMDGDVVRHLLPVGPNPIFVTGVNPAVAKWCRDFEFLTTNLANEFGREQAIEYRFKNTFPQGLAGRVRIHVPDSWQVSKQDAQFKLAAGEEFVDRLHVVLGPDASTGKQAIRVDFHLIAESDIDFSLTQPLEVGIGDVFVELDSRLDDEGNLIVEQRLINNQEEPISFNCMLFAPGRRRDKRQCFYLNRGQTTNIFVLPNGQELLGKTLWLRAEEIGGARILNERLVAHE